MDQQSPAAPAAAAPSTEVPPHQPSAATSRPITRWLVGMTVAHALNDLYGLALPPLLPALRAAFALSYFQVGFMAFTVSGISATLQSVVGYTADRRGWRRPALATGFLLYAAGMVVLSRAGNYPGLLLAAAVLALASTSYHPQAITLLTRTFPHARGWASGIHGIGNSIGFTISPLIIGTLAQLFGWQTATLLMAAPALIGAGYVWWLVREPAARAARGLLAGITRPLALLTAVHGLVSLAGLGFITFLPTYYVGLGHGLFGAGLLTAIVLTAGMVAQPLGGTISDRLGRRFLLLWASVAVGTMILLFAAVGSSWSPLHGTAQLILLVVCSFGFEFAISLTPPVALVYAAELAPGGRSGTTVGLAWGVGIAVAAVGAPLTGKLIDTSGFGVAYLVLAGAAWLGGILALRLPGPSTDAARGR